MKENLRLVTVVYVTGIYRIGESQNGFQSVSKFAGNGHPSTVKPVDAAPQNTHQTNPINLSTATHPTEQMSATPKHQPHKTKSPKTTQLSRT